VGKLPQDLLGKVKTGSGRGKRAGRSGKNSLVTDVISLVALAPDVGRQRHQTACVKIDILIERDNALAFRQDFLDAQTYIVDLRRRADTHFSAWLDQTLPAPRANAFEKQEFNRAIARHSFRGKHSRVVQNEKVARAKKHFQLNKSSMLD
jgi:hypothetical protein